MVVAVIIIVIVTVDVVIIIIITLYFAGCEMGAHKHCVDNITEMCSGNKKKAGKRASAFIPVLGSQKKSSNPNQPAGNCNQVVSLLNVFWVGLWWWWWW
jgi:hypothetical protein